MKKKILSILLSVVVAFGLWLYVVSVEYTKVELPFYNIRVNWVGLEEMESQGLKLMNDETRINMKLYGNRSVLNKLQSDDIIVLADLNYVDSAGEDSVSYVVSFSGVDQNAIEIVDKPTSIDVQVARWIWDKVIPVTVNTDKVTMSAPVGDVHFVVDEAKVTTDLKTLEIEGPYEVVDQIAQAIAFPEKTADRDNDLRESVKLALCDKDGNRIEDVSQVFVSPQDGKTHVTVPILAEKSVPLQMEIQYGDLVHAGVPQISYYVGDKKVDSLTIRGALSEVQKVSSENILGINEIVLKDHLNGYEETLNVQLPEGVWCEEGSQVTVKVEAFQTLSVRLSERKEFTGDFEVSMDGNPILTVVYFGTEAISEDDLKIKLLNELAEGRMTIAFEVTLYVGGEAVSCACDTALEVNAMVAMVQTVDLSEEIGVEV